MPPLFFLRLILMCNALEDTTTLDDYAAECHTNSLEDESVLLYALSAVKALDDTGPRPLEMIRAMQNTITDQTDLRAMSDNCAGIPLTPQADFFTLLADLADGTQGEDAAHPLVPDDYVITHP